MCLVIQQHLSSWAAAKNEPKASDRALELLHAMENQCALGNEGICPNTVAHTAVINCLGRSGKPGAALQAYDILLEMDKKYREGNEDLRPDLISYSSVIDAFARSGEEYAGEKAVELLDHMITLAELGHKEFGPNTQCYCSVITALGKSKARGGADVAHQLLADMEKMYALGNNDVAPNTIIFNAAIDAWARSSFVYKAARAQSLLMRMEDEVEAGNIMYKPDIITYNSVISAGASSFGDEQVKSQAFRIAMDAFKRIQLSEDILPTSRTYALLMKAVRKLIASEEQHDRMCGKIMEYCVRDGLFNSYILTQLELTCSRKKVAHAILERLGYKGSDPSDMKSIPLTWKCNANRIR
jgi:pentatricopeptide repeat protein